MQRPKIGTDIISDVIKEQKKQKQRNGSKLSSPSSLIELLKSSSSFDRETLISSLPTMVVDHRTHKVKSAKPHLFVLQTVKKHYEAAVDYQTYRLFYRSSRCDKMVFSYIGKLVEKSKPLMKAHFLILKDPILIIKFLAILKPCP